MFCVSFSARMIVAVVFGCIAAAAQQEATAPAADSPQPETITEQPGESDIPVDEMFVNPDTRPVTSAVVGGFGSWGPRKSFFIPKLYAGEALDSNPMMQDSGSYRGFTDLAAELKGIAYLGRSAEIRYAGTLRFDSMAKLYAERQVTNSHDLQFIKDFDFGRTKVHLNDEAQYSEGSFGVVGMEGLGAMSTRLDQWGGFSSVQLPSTALVGGLTPDQSILTWRSSRLSNTVVGEVDRQLGARNFVTLAGDYGLLHFYSTPMVNSAQAGGFGGYGRLLSERDSVGLVYGFSRFTFSGEDYDLRTQYGSLLYQRRLTQRLEFQAGAGPEHTWQAGDAAGYSNLGWQGGAYLSFRARRVNLGASFTRMLTAGSGVLFGTRTTSGQVNSSLPITKKLNFSMDGGIAHNAGVLAAEAYNTEYGDATLSRTITSTISIFLSYSIQNQTLSNSSTGNGSTAVGTRQVIGAGFSWTRRPYALY